MTNPDSQTVTRYSGITHEDVLDLLTEWQGETLSLAEICETLEARPSSVVRILRRLSEGPVEHRTVFYCEAEKGWFYARSTASLDAA